MLGLNKIALLLLLTTCFSLGFAQSDKQNDLSKKKNDIQNELKKLNALEKETKLMFEASNITSVEIKTPIMDFLLKTKPKTPTQNKTAESTT